MQNLRYYSTFVILLFILFVNRSESFTRQLCIEEEIFFELIIQNRLSVNMEGIICGDQLYLPVSKLLTELKIQHQKDEFGEEITINWPDKTNKIVIDFGSKQINGDFSEIEIGQSDATYTEFYNEWLLTKELIEEVLQFSLNFSFRELEIRLFSHRPLPIINEQNRTKGYAARLVNEYQFEVDEFYTPSRKVINGLATSWSLNSTISEYSKNHTVGLSLGGNALGGDILISGRAMSEYGINPQTIHANWKYPFYNNRAITQINLGVRSHKDIFGRSGLQFTGAEISNKPLHSRYHFGDFNLEGYAQPGWDVELYRFNELVDVIQTTEGSPFNFQQPMRYGSNRFSLRYYSPMGFSHEENYNVLIPQNQLPRGKAEYSLQAGRYRLYDADFLRTSTNIGLLSFLTVGGGHQITTTPLGGLSQDSFVSASVRAGSKMLLDLNHTFDYITEASMQILYHDFQSINLRFTHFQESSPFQKRSLKYDGFINMAFPVKMGNLRSSLTFNIQTSGFDHFESTSLNTGLMLSFKKGYLVHLRNRITYRSHNYNDFKSLNNEQIVMISKRMFRHFTFRPGTSYSLREKSFTGLNFQVVNTAFRRANISASYNRNFWTKQNRFFFTFRYNFNFARYHSTLNVSHGGNISLNHNLTGYSYLDTSNGDLFVDDQNKINSSVIRLEPYFVNSEEQEIDNQLKIQKLEASVYRRGSRYSARIDGNTIQNLIPYENFIITIDPSSFENPLWRPQKTTFRVQTNPYGVNVLKIPVTVVGEVEGMVLVPEDLSANYSGGLIVNLKNEDGSFNTSVKTYTGGQFYYLGLHPGTYTASLDTLQLAGRSLKAEQNDVSFTIKASPYGDIYEDLRLSVTRKESAKKTDTLQNKIQNSTAQKGTEANNTNTDERFEPGSENDIKILPTDKTAKETLMFLIQIGSFASKPNAENFAAQISELTANHVTVHKMNERYLYRCTIGEFIHFRNAKSELKRLKQEYPDIFKDAFITKHLNR